MKIDAMLSHVQNLFVESTFSFSYPAKLRALHIVGAQEVFEWINIGAYYGSL